MLRLPPPLQDQDVKIDFMQSRQGATASVSCPEGVTCSLDTAGGEATLKGNRLITSSQAGKEDARGRARGGRKV